MTEKDQSTTPEADVFETADASLFNEPEDYYPPSPPPTTQTYHFPYPSETSSSGAPLPTLHLTLVGSSPSLEAHTLWNGARITADFFSSHPATIRGRTVLELGAGAGLPSIAAGVLGAARVVATDYPDPDVLAVLQANVDAAGVGRRVAVAGHVWGRDPAPLLALLRNVSSLTDGQGQEEEACGRKAGEEKEGEEGEEEEEKEDRKFDVLILADLLFRHSEHANIIKSVRATLARRRSAGAYVFFTSYRPWLRHKDLAFFDEARRCGLEVEEVLEVKTARPLFEDDPGDEEVRRTVSGFVLRWPAGECEEQLLA
jgi:EEF1A N-terminal glycine/lysine methyltransferase